MKALILDTETTDLIANSLLPLDQQPRVIEFFGHIVEDDGTVCDELEFFCNPGRPLDPKITQITGIADEQVRNAPRFADLAPGVIELIHKAEAVVAHNLSYDYAVLEGEFKRCGLFPTWPVVRICTVENTEWIKGYRLKLADLHAELFGVPFSGAHRARTDVEALTRCYLELRKRGDL